MNDPHKQISPLEGFFQYRLKEKPDDKTEISTGETIFDQVIAEQHQFNVDIVTRLHEVETAVKKQAGLFICSTSPINTLANPKWDLKKSLIVAVEQRGREDFVACLYDVDLYGYGDSIPEALDDLRAALVNQLEYLMVQEGKIKLSESLRKQLSFLKSNVVKKNA